MALNKFFLTLKILSIIAVIILVFAVIIPKIKQIDQLITAKIRGFFDVFFQATVTVGKKSRDGFTNYSKEDFKSIANSFTRKILDVTKKEDLSGLIKNGESLLVLDSKNVNIRSKLAFLYYMNGNFKKAVENYDFVLARFPERKFTFQRLKNNEDYRFVKRTLLELAALYYDMHDKEKMLSYYTKYLRVSNRKIAFHDMVKEGINERQAWYGIFSEFGGAGLLSYEKAIKELEGYFAKYPEDKQVLLVLGILNYEVANLYFDSKLGDIDKYIKNSEKYLTSAFEYVDSHGKTDINKKLGQLGKIQAEKFPDKSKKTIQIIY